MIKNIIDKLMSELGVMELSDHDKYELTAQLLNHFNNVVIRVVMSNLNDQQLIEFNKLLENADDKKLEEEIAKLVATIPGINVQIEEAINLEIQNIKSAKEIMSVE